MNAQRRPPGVHNMNGPNAATRAGSRAERITRRESPKIRTPERAERCNACRIMPERLNGPNAATRESPKIRTPERITRRESPKIRTPERITRRESPKIRTPERLQRNKQCRANRGGWRQYYDRKEWAANMRKHRQHKHALYVAGKITPPAGILTSTTPEITSATPQEANNPAPKPNNYGAYQKNLQKCKKVVDIVKKLYYNDNIKGKKPNRAGGTSKEQSKGA